MKRIILFASIALLFAFRASAQTAIPAKDAAKHIGENVTICEKVWSTKFIDASNITFLDLGDYHPNQLLTIVIKGEDRAKFKGKPEDDFKGRSICVTVTGTVIDYKGKPEIVVTDPQQLKINYMDNPKPVEQKLPGN